MLFIPSVSVSKLFFVDMSTVAPDHQVSGVFPTLWDDAVDDPSLSPLQATGTRTSRSSTRATSSTRTTL
jgi:hypothetical protein